MIMDPCFTSDFASMLPQALQVLPAFFMLSIFYSANAQSAASLRFDKRMKQLKTGHAAVLAFWAGLNLVTGSMLLFTPVNEQLAYFYTMNSCWGLVNLGVAWFIYSHHNEVFNQPQTLLQQMDHQRHVEKAILFNIGLNMAFIASGFALERHGHASSVSNPALWKGFGTSIILQGAFLLVQDTIFYLLHRKNRRKVYPLWQQRTEGR